MTEIHFKYVNKDYGKHIDKALILLEQGAKNEIVFKETGCQVGLRNINLVIPSGKISCVMGLSGSGKSTLVRHINRLIEPSGGEVWAGDVNVTALSEKALRAFRQQQVSMVFQHFGLLPHLTVLQNVEYALRVRRLPEAMQREQAQHWLNEVGLSGYEASFPDQLSGGMRQRVGLARALTADTEIILMDEAFSALDPLIRTKLQDQLLTLQSKLNKTIIFITHDINEAVKMGKHIAILNGGELVQMGEVEELVNHPANEYVAEFMQFVLDKGEE